LSQRALLLAVRDRLRQTIANGGLAYLPQQCEIMPTGMPPPACGEFFVAIHEGEWSFADIEGLDEMMGVEVTVTMRAAKVPKDKLGTNLLVGPTGQSLYDQLEKIRAKLHMDPGPRSSTDASHYPVLALANTTIGTGENGFVEPLRFRGPAGKTQEVYADWFTAEAMPGSPPLGLVRTLVFGGARRIQTIEEQS